MEDHDHANVDDHHQTDESNVDPAYQVSGIHIRYELAVNDHVVGVGEDQGFVQQLKLIVNRKSKWFNLANHDECEGALENKELRLQPVVTGHDDNEDCKAESPHGEEYTVKHSWLESVLQPIN